MTDLEQLLAERDIRYLVDHSAYLADQRSVEGVLAYYHPDAILQAGDLQIRGHEALAQLFSQLLAEPEVISHHNGQLIVTLESATLARGISYCQSVYVGVMDGKRQRQTTQICYTDTYTKTDGKWVIKHRISEHIWQTNCELELEEDR
ncbi:ketosteroid isomerase-like protein [Streptococcus rupicaprae]|uniref:Ketosteroid isomerase-like protein n=1 Tax=Streptococcus rupicaprae TaxID=759619 RepID=A0ABV2FES3_9STRE